MADKFPTITGDYLLKRSGKRYTLDELCNRIQNLKNLDLNYLIAVINIKNRTRLYPKSHMDKKIEIIVDYAKKNEENKMLIEYHYMLIVHDIY